MRLCCNSAHMSLSELVSARLTRRSSLPAVASPESRRCAPRRSGLEAVCMCRDGPRSSERRTSAANSERRAEFIWMSSERRRVGVPSGPCGLLLMMPPVRWPGAAPVSLSISTPPILTPLRIEPPPPSGLTGLEASNEMPRLPPGRAPPLQFCPSGLGLDSPPFGTSAAYFSAGATCRFAFRPGESSSREPPVEQAAPIAGQQRRRCAAGESCWSLHSIASSGWLTTTHGPNSQRS